jgi:hypothetical protein
MESPNRSNRQGKFKTAEASVHTAMCFGQHRDLSLQHSLHEIYALACDDERPRFHTNK